MKIIDFHTHVFPDAIAERAIPQLEEEGDITASLDGKLSTLLRSMDAAGIERAVTCSIATKPDQFESILRFSRKIASERIVPFPSVHPADGAAAANVRRIAGEGFRGLKLHPYYQDFDLDDERRAFPIFEAAEEAGLIVVVHSGFDIAFPRVRKGDAAKALAALERFPDLVLVNTHLGGWDDWEEARRLVIGKPIWLEFSMCFGYLEEETIRAMLLAHPAEYLLFGTDSPWAAQGEAIERVRRLGLGEDRERKIFGENAERLLA